MISVPPDVYIESGEHITDAVHRVVTMAREQNREFTFEFNGVRMLVGPAFTRAALLDFYVIERNRMNHDYDSQRHLG